MSAAEGNTAVLPVGQQVNKNTEITPDPSVLAKVAYVVTVRASGLVLVYDKDGRVVARYFDEPFARDEFKEAGLDFDKMTGTQRLKDEDAARKAAKRVVSPNRRLRAERRDQRKGKDKASASTAPSES